MNTHIVAEATDGQVIKTHLPKEEATRLYRKIRAAGGEAYIYSDLSEQYLIDLFIVGGADISNVETATITDHKNLIHICDIKFNSELLLDAIQKVKFKGWVLCPF